MPLQTAAPVDQMLVVLATFELVPTPSINNCPIGNVESGRDHFSRLAPQVLQRLPGQLLRGNLVVLTSRIERRRQDRHAEKRYAANFFFRGRVRVRRAPSRVWGGRSEPYRSSFAAIAVSEYRE